MHSFSWIAFGSVSVTKTSMPIFLVHSYILRARVSRRREGRTEVGYMSIEYEDATFDDLAWSLPLCVKFFDDTCGGTGEVAGGCSATVWGPGLLCLLLHQHTVRRQPGQHIGKAVAHRCGTLVCSPVSNTAGRRISSAGFFAEFPPCPHVASESA